MVNRRTPPTRPEALPGIPAPASRFDVTRRRAFGSVPGLLDCGEPTAPVYEVERLVDIANLQRLLYQQGPDDKRGLVVDGLALNSEEYTDIARNPEALQRAVGARTVASRTLRGDTNVDRVDSRELVSQMKMLIAKGTKHGERITQYALEINRLRELGKLARSPGYALATEGELRILAVEVWTTSFEGVLKVAALRGRWDGSTQMAATDAMAYRLTKGPQRTRMGYWQEMGSLTERYVGNKKLLFTQRRDVLRAQYRSLNQQLRAQNNAFFENR